MIVAILILRNDRDYIKQLAAPQLRRIKLDDLAFAGCFGDIRERRIERLSTSKRRPLLVATLSADGRYAVRIVDLELNASTEHFYRVSVGSFPFVTGAFPLGVPANAETSVDLIGWNLPATSKATVKAGGPGEVDVALDRGRFRSRRGLKVVTSSLSESLETEPNDSPSQATVIQAPGAANGRIWRQDRSVTADQDLYRFSARAGETWVIETEASRRGSPCDTKIEILGSSGAPMPRVLLQAVRDSYLSFRGVDSNQAGDFRIKNWEEMELNQFLYLQGEVVRLFRAPQGPDSGFVVYSRGGLRRTYFGTSANTHALDATCYVVDPHEPGTKLIGNGLPIFDIAYTNDDDSDRRLGTDSQILFTAPAAGEYLVRVTDSRGQDGDRFSYRLVLRGAQPDFSVAIQGANPSVGAGSGRSFTVVADRRDGFEGAIAVHVAGVPEGFTVSTPIVIEAGHVEAQGTLLAASDAKQPGDESAAQIHVTAEATIDGKQVVHDVASLGKIKLEAKPKLLVRLEPAAGAKEINIAPGEMVPAMLRIERNGHDDLVTFQVDNLPHGIIVDDIGLSGVLIRKGENERQIFITAAKWVPEADRYAYAIESQAGGQTSPPVLVRVRRK